MSIVQRQSAPPTIDQLDRELVRKAALELAGRAMKKYDVAEKTRNAAIVNALKSGSSLREVAEVTGLSHTGVNKIAKRYAVDAIDD